MVWEKSIQQLSLRCLVVCEFNMEVDSMAAIKGKAVAALLLFGMALLDSDFDPLRNFEDFLNSALVLAVIFFGDVIFKK